MVIEMLEDCELFMLFLGVFRVLLYAPSNWRSAADRTRARARQSGNQTHWRVTRRSALAPIQLRGGTGRVTEPVTESGPVTAASRVTDRPPGGRRRRLKMIGPQAGTAPAGPIDGQ